MILLCCVFSFLTTSWQDIEDDIALPQRNGSARLAHRVERIEMAVLTTVLLTSKKALGRLIRLFS